MHKYRLSVHGSNVLAVIMTLYMFYYFNRIYNKILDRDWLSARLVSVQLPVPNFNFSWLDTCDWIPTSFKRQLRALEWLPS